MSQRFLRDSPFLLQAIKSGATSCSIATALDVARCFETGNFSLLDALTIKLKLNSIATAQAYFTAVRWTKAFFEITETVASPL